MTELEKKASELLFNGSDIVKKIPSNSNLKDEEKEQAEEDDESDDVVVWALRFLGDNISEKGQTVADGIMSVGVFLSLSLLWGAWLMEQDVEQKDVKISPTLKKGIQSLKKVTPHAASFTKSVRDTILDGAEYAATKAYHYFKPEDKEHEESQRKKAAYKFASQTVGTLVTVWDNLEDAGERVLRTAADSSTKVVTARYGDEAGGVMSDSLSVGEDILKTGYYARGLTPARAGKKMGKHAAKTVVKTHVAEKKKKKLAALEGQHAEEIPENAIEMEHNEVPAICMENAVSPDHEAILDGFVEMEDIPQEEIVADEIDDSYGERVIG